MNGVPRGRSVWVHTFRGDQTAAFRQQFFNALADEEAGRGRGPTPMECLLFAGHTGVSTNSDGPIYGFNPDGRPDLIWQVMRQLRNGGAYPGVVRNDTTVFAAARQVGLTVLTFEVALSQRSFQGFRLKLSRELKQSRFDYSFPNGDGDCNCTTWIERLGLPLLTGRMDEFTAIPSVIGVSATTSRTLFCFQSDKCHNVPNSLVQS